ncbi:MAG: cytidylate kinase [Planctomycetota bacterium]|jgi:cytidylate kinase
MQPQSTHQSVDPTREYDPRSSDSARESYANTASGAPSESRSQSDHVPAERTGECTADEAEEDGVRVGFEDMNQGVDHDQAVRVIAIDGPAGSGKSTVAKRLAAVLGSVFLDTGAMYRAVTLACLERGADPKDAEACTAVACSLSLDFDDEGRVLIDGSSREDELRGDAVTERVSFVAAHSGVRRAMVQKQRAVAKAAGASGVVAEGRDMSSVVFPETPFKFYLLATSKERARRRAEQAGRSADVDRIEQELGERDRLDSTREDSPLMMAADARSILTDELSVDQVVETIRSAIDAAPGSQETTDH